MPYALYAKSAGSVNSGTGITISSVSATGDSLFLSNGQTFVSGGNSGGNSGGSPVNGYSHYIGEEFGGGVVFHLWKDTLGVEHGLIVDKTTIMSNLIIATGDTIVVPFYYSNVVWSNIETVNVGSTAQSFSDGLSNSIAIVGQAGHTNSAAALCLNSNNGGQDDWYLPSLGELNMLWNNFSLVNQQLSQSSGAQQLNSQYFSTCWSSTELTISQGAWYLSLDSGVMGNRAKNGGLSVRAIRAF